MASSVLSRIVHPQLFTSLAAFFPATCAIQAVTLSQDAYGAAVETWVTVPGYEALPCGVAPLNPQSPTDSKEYRTEAMTVTMATHQIKLTGYYPALTTGMRAVVNGVAHNVLAVEHDSQRQATRLKTEIVSV